MLSLFAMIYLKGEFRIFFCTTTDFHRRSSPPMQPFYDSPFHLEIEKISSVSRTVYEGTHKLKKSIFSTNKIIEFKEQLNRRDSSQIKFRVLALRHLRKMARLKHTSVILVSKMAKFKQGSFYFVFRE